MLQTLSQPHHLVLQAEINHESNDVKARFVLDALLLHPSQEVFGEEKLLFLVKGVQVENETEVETKLDVRLHKVLLRTV